ncbi:hypothetical protein SMD44_00781 [Streptomyces alboflavus]|uniref:Uncharacterized protein n=1 Tax=Streptomyces alboflavus TaxID=67267 RepID=A0A1Z1W4M3_9ACTN|nr:hypothetical protein SMD44_00781 [Streptomyces alboflavus]
MLEYLGFHLSFAHRAEPVPSDILGDLAALSQGRLRLGRTCAVEVRLVRILGSATGRHPDAAATP